MSPTLTSGKATTGPCWPLCIVECPWSGVEHGRACTSVKLEALVNARFCIRGWKGTAGGEPQRKKRPWQRKRNFSPILTTLEFLSCHLAYQELQTIVKTPSNLRTHHLSFCAFFSQGLMRVKWDFVLILALASNHLSVWFASVG